MDVWKNGGRVCHSWHTVKCTAPFTAGSTQSKETAEQRATTLALCLSLKSSLILSAAEQCLTGAHNHFMAQI